MRFEAIRATQEHAAELAGRLRRGDALEIADGFGGPPETLLSVMVEHSDEAYAWTHDGAVVCLWGVTLTSHVPLSADVWLMTSALVETAPVTFTKMARRTVTRWLADYEVLTAYVDERYTQAGAWIKALGFVPGEIAYLGTNAAVFRAYRRMRMH